MDYTIFVVGKGKPHTLQDFRGELATAAQEVVASLKEPLSSDAKMLLVYQRVVSDCYTRPDAVFELRDGQAVEPPTKFWLNSSNVFRAVKVVGVHFSHPTVLRVWPIQPPAFSDHAWQDLAQPQDLYDREEEALEMQIERAEGTIDWARRRLRELEGLGAGEEEEEAVPLTTKRIRPPGMRP